MGVRPTWLTEAREHLRQHYPTDGASLSCLYALAAVGFDPGGAR